MVYSTDVEQPTCTQANICDLDCKFKLHKSQNIRVSIIIPDNTTCPGNVMKLMTNHMHKCGRIINKYQSIGKFFQEDIQNCSRFPGVRDTLSSSRKKSVLIVIRLTTSPLSS